MTADPTVTVVVLTFNAQRWISRQLAALRTQQAPFDFDVLIIDSGSRDGTVEEVRAQITSWSGRLQLHEIPNHEFGHGRTRNLAAQMARGTFVAFLTHDAIPAHDRWLAELIRPFRLSDEIVCVYGRQIPWDECPPTIKRDVINTFRRFGPEFAITVQELNPQVKRQMYRDAVAFFSDVNSAVRRSVLIDEVPFRDLDYAEDQRFAQDILAAGYVKAYSPFASVVHSHNYPLLTYFRRQYDEKAGVKNATGRSMDMSLPRHIGYIGRSTMEDWLFTLRDPTYSRATKIKWGLQAPMYNLARGIAIRISSHPNLPPAIRRFASLEGRQRRLGR